MGLVGQAGCGGGVVGTRWRGLGDGFEGFAEFESRVLGATHSAFDVDANLYDEVKARFLPHINDDGIAEFHNPTRVDLLRKPTPA